ncbi:MAG: hypothetical protein EBT86_09755 [Actinobacteria bacterium]|nr:hypothetical protein [Actinomycetota bacterium]
MGRKQGELEAQVLDAIWDLEESGASNLSSAEILKAFSGSKEIALTTLLTVLSRLADKGLVVRDKVDGKSLVFRSAKSRNEATVEALLNLVEEAENPEVVVANFLGALPKKLRGKLVSELDKDN